jgi:hypothetical protein
MATSNSWDYSLTAAGIISIALENLGITTVTSAMSTLCLRRLNIIAKQWQGNSDMAPGLKVHTRNRVTLVMAKGQQSYLIGPASGDARSSTLMGRTTISALEAAGQTVISITSNTDTTSYPGTTITMASADFVGIQLDDGTIQWTTISGTPAATMTINVALTAAASAGNYVWWFTARAQRFPLIESAVLRNSSFSDVALDIYRDSREYDLQVPTKYTSGTVNSILVEPLRLNTRVTLNYQPSDITSTIVMTVLYPAEDYDATTDDVAFTAEWMRALAWELSFEVAPTFGRPWTAEREKNRMEALSWARSVNPEKSVAYFQPEIYY